MKDYLRKHTWMPGSAVVILVAMPLLILAKDIRSWSRFIEQLEEFDQEKKLQDASPEQTIHPQAINVPIFIYHSVNPRYPGETALQDAYDITPELFEAHLQYLESHHYTAVSLDDLADYFDTGKSLPPNPVILNFDDGWENQFIYAFPLLRKYHDSATFFIYMHVVGYKHFLSWKEIEEMVQGGMRIGAHTKTHPLLAHITNSDQLRDEIAGSKKILEDRLQQPVTVFAYPYGQYNDGVVRAVQEAGFRMARSTYRGVYHTRSDRYTLKAILVSDSMEDFVRMLQAAQEGSTGAAQ